MIWALRVQAGDRVGWYCERCKRLLAQHLVTDPVPGYPAHMCQPEPPKFHTCESGRECLNLQESARELGRREAVAALYAEAERLRDAGEKKQAATFAAAACFLETAGQGSARGSLGSSDGHR